jgi:hypothetical protein
MEFNEFKNEILRRAKEANACNGAYRRAYQSNDYNELMQVIKDNFGFAVANKVIDPSLIEAYKDEFNATVKAWGNATVKASDNATVKAWGNATVEAWGNATVEAWGNATV